MGTLKFNISAQSFFQVNSVQAEKLYNKAIEFAALSGGETVVDCYCGTGTISLYLAKHAQKVYGIEIIASAIEDAKRNAEDNRCDNAEFILGDAAVKMQELVEQGVVAPLDDYLDELGVDLSTMYSETSLESVTFDGSIYAVPLDTHAEIMYFNKDILDQAGVALNDKGQLAIASEDDFYTVCDKIKAVIPEGGSVISLTNNGDDPYRVWWATYFQMGGTPLVNEDDSEVTMDKDIAVKAAEFVKSLYDKGYVAEGIDDHQQFFQSGKAGIYIGGTWGTGALEKTENLNFGAMPYPQMFDKNACWADSHTLILPTKKDRSEEDSKAAVEFMVSASEKGGLTWAGSGQIPASNAVRESQEYLDMPYRSSYMEALETAVLPSKVSTFNAMKSGMIDSLNTLWSGDTDAEEAVGMLYDELDTNLP